MTARLFAAIWAFAAVTLASPAAAQDAGEAAVRATVEGFMHAFDAKDADGMVALITEDAYLALVQPAEDGDRIQSMRLHDLVTGITAIPGDIAEPLDIRAVMVDEPVAMVWADFGFYLDGQRSHCGVDVFTLMRVDGDWKIVTVTYSHLTEGCEGAPRP